MSRNAAIAAEIKVLDSFAPRGQMPGDIFGWWYRNLTGVEARNAIHTLQFKGWALTTKDYVDPKGSGDEVQSISLVYTRLYYGPCYIEYIFVLLLQKMSDRRLNGGRMDEYLTENLSLNYKQTNK